MIDVEQLWMHIDTTFSETQGRFASPQTVRIPRPGSPVKKQHWQHAKLCAFACLWHRSVPACGFILPARRLQAALSTLSLGREPCDSGRAAAASS